MRPNNFDIVRLLLASTVVFVHCHDLSTSAALAFVTRILNSGIAVEGFFAISGFLIFASYERSGSITEYFSNRAFRILPGYWLSTSLCVAIAFGMGHFHVGKFLLANLSFLNFLHPGIPGAFEANPTTTAMNGALWTIKIELMFYLSVPPILWLCRRLHRDIVLIALIFLSVVWRIYFAAHDQIARQLPGQLSCFLVGTLIFYHLAFFKRHGRILMFAAAALYLLHTHTGWLLLRPFAVSSLTLGACLLAPHVEGPARWGDFSYGTYVLHFPIIQSVVAMGVFDISPWLGLIVSLFLVAMAAVLSWKFIESPALRYGKARKTRQSPISAPLDCPPAKCNVP